jgi:hypothetical protein
VQTDSDEERAESARRSDGKQRKTATAASMLYALALAARLNQDLSREAQFAHVLVTSAGRRVTN